MPPNDLTGHVIEPELGRHILGELAELNADFIALALSLKVHRLMPADQMDELRGLSKPAVRRLTGCAFALFDLRLRDPVLFQAIRDGDVDSGLTEISQPGNGESRRIKLFTLSALMYLRHLSGVNRFFASLSFDAAPATLDIVNELPLNGLREIADRCPGLLRSRFTDLPAAWNDLIKLARRNDAEPMLPAKMLGYQHLKPR